MKKTFTVLLAFAVCMMLTVPAFAANNYDFSSGGETLTGFGKSTSNDDPVSPSSMNENIRRNKDAAYLPPPYFYGSGEIPTDPSSLYHSSLPGGAASGYSDGVSGTNGGTSSANIGGSAVSISLPEASGFQASTSTMAINGSSPFAVEKKCVV